MSADKTVEVDGMGTVTVSQLVDLIRVSETAERYEDMCTFVELLVKTKASDNIDLDVEERNLLSVAFKNIVGSKRASWRTLSGGFDDTDDNDDLIEQYKSIVETELELSCQRVLSLISESLLKTVKGNNDETEVFYLKMCGDYYRYLSEFRVTNDEYKNSSKEYYEKAMNIANEHLNETHPTRLGLALNFSVCYYEILKEPTKACDLAKKAFDSAIEKLDTLNDASYKDSTLIMQLLRDNLTLWTSEQGDDNDED